MMDVTQLKKFAVLSMFSDLQLECLAKVAEIKALDPDSPVDEPCKPSEWLRIDDLAQPWKYSLAEICLGDSEVMSINAEGLFDMWEAEPHVGHVLMRQLALLYLHLHTTVHLRVHKKLEKPTVVTVLMS